MKAKVALFLLALAACGRQQHQDNAIYADLSTNAREKLRCVIAFNYQERIDNILSSRSSISNNIEIDNDQMREQYYLDDLKGAYSQIDFDDRVKTALNAIPDQSPEWGDVFSECLKKQNDAPSFMKRYSDWVRERER